MIPIGALVTATNPSGEKTHGNLEDIDSYGQKNILLIRDGHDFDFKWFLEKEVKIRFPHHTISRPFTLWQLNALLGYQVNEWSWDGDLLDYIYEYFSDI